MHDPRGSDTGASPNSGDAELVLRVYDWGKEISNVHSPWLKKREREVGRGGAKRRAAVVRHRTEYKKAVARCNRPWTGPQHTHTHTHTHSHTHTHNKNNNAIVSHM
jgi:hypothetical protein